MELEDIRYVYVTVYLFSIIRFGTAELEKREAGDHKANKLLRFAFWIIVTIG